MPRDRISELIDIKRRRHELFPSADDLEALHSKWLDLGDDVTLFDDLLPARIVTLLEVILRYWIERLVDRGAPYVERAAQLKTDLKYDYAIAKSLHGRSVTLGQCISHSVSLSSLEAVSTVMKILIGEDLFAALARTKRREDLDDLNSVCIVSDVESMRGSLARLFSVRHVLVHEFPERNYCSRADLDAFFFAARMFAQALDEYLTQMLFGRYPLSQVDMNSDAYDRWEAINSVLQDLCKSVAENEQSDSIHEVQKAWDAFADAESRRVSAGYEGGSMRPLMQCLCLIELTEKRVAELKAGIDDQRDR